MSKPKPSPRPAYDVTVRLDPPQRGERDMVYFHVVQVWPQPDKYVQEVLEKELIRSCSKKWGIGELHGSLKEGYTFKVGLPKDD